MENGRFVFPEVCKYIRIDIGLGNDATHAKIWLRHRADRCVLGFEPYPPR